MIEDINNDFFQILFKFQKGKDLSFRASGPMRAEAEVLDPCFSAEIGNRQMGEGY